MNTIVENVTDLIGNTPLLRLKKLVDSTQSAEILAKLEVFNPGGSIKDRACFAMIEQAEKEGKINKDTLIIEPTSGNTGIGLAMICAAKGYKCVLTMPEEMSLERIYLLRNYGAEVILTPSRQGIPGAIKKAEELAKKNPNSFIPRQFDNPANPDMHRKTTAKEILEATDGKIDAFVAGVGTGGTITGIGEALKQAIPDIKVIAVEPKTSAVLSGDKAGKHRIQGIGAGFVPGILNKDIIDDIVPVSERDAFNMTRELGRKEGLSVGISAGAAFVAATKAARDLGPNKRVVVIVPDSADRYFSLEQYFVA